MTAELEECRALAAKMADILPSQIDAFSTSQKYKTAMKAQVIHASLIWRQDELARCSIALIENGDFVAASLLARAMMETTAVLIYVHNLIENALRAGMDDNLDDRLAGILTGSKAWEELPGAINVLTAVQKVDKMIPGYETKYKLLSEAAHPNWLGTQGAYGVINHETGMISFSRDGQPDSKRPRYVTIAVASALDLFISYYEALADLILPFAQLVEEYFDAKAAR